MIDTMGSNSMTAGDDARSGRRQEADNMNAQQRDIWELMPPGHYYDENDSVNVCLSCQTPRYKLRYRIKGFGLPIDFMQCRCGIIKQTPMPTTDFFEWFYNSDLFYSSKDVKSESIWGYYDYFKDEPCRLATSRWRYRRLAPFFDSKRRLDIMKIGPSTGTFLHVANEHGHNAIGCDISERFVQFAKERYGVRIDCGRFEHLPYESESFDRILMFHVLENIPNLREVLEKVRERLRPGGLFVLNYTEMRGNIIERIQRSNYFLYRPPICYLFEGDALKQTLRKAGLEPIHMCRDFRIVNLSRVLSTLRVTAPLRLLDAVRLSHVPFPIYAYPFWIIVARRI